MNGVAKKRKLNVYRQEVETDRAGLSSRAIM